MRYFVAPLTVLACIATFAITAANAAPYEGKNIAADSKWVIHVDVDAIRDSQIVKKAFENCPILKNSGAAFDLVRGQIGIDLRTDLHGITLYGPDADKKHAVAIVFSTVNRQLLMEKAQKATDHKMTRHGRYEVHSWTSKHGGKSEPGAGALYKPDVLVFAADADQVAKALDVLDGKSPGITDAESPLGTRGVNGATLIVRAFDFPAEAHNPVLKKTASVRIAMGEYQGKSFYRERLVMKSAESAEQVKTITEGLKAIGQLHLSGDADAMKLVNGLNATVSGSTVTIRWEASADDVWTVIEKASKKIEEHIKKAKEKRPSQQKSDDV